MMQQQPLMIRRWWLVAVLTALSAACASVGLQSAQSFDERLAYGYATYTAINDTVASSLDFTVERLNAGTITKEQALAEIDQAKHMQAQLVQARTDLDTAKAIADNHGDLSTAEGRLRLAVVLLEELQAALRAKELSHGS